jgi:hypothetical protein
MIMNPAASIAHQIKISRIALLFNKAFVCFQQENIAGTQHNVGDILPEPLAVACNGHHHRVIS